jgi:hypothetical protein
MKSAAPISLKSIGNLGMSAASGLLLLGRDFYVVSDDELNLYKFTQANMNAPSAFASFQESSQKIPNYERLKNQI